MTTRFNVATDTPELYKALFALNGALAELYDDARLVHLIKIRVSQINGCAYCVDMHVKEALRDGVPEQILHMISVWRESSAFDARDRAALAWAESVTLLADTHVPDEDYEAVRKEFSEADISRLTVVVAAMNLWNRIGVSARMTA